MEHWVSDLLYWQRLPVSFVSQLLSSEVLLSPPFASEPFVSWLTECECLVLILNHHQLLFRSLLNARAIAAMVGIHVVHPYTGCFANDYQIFQLKKKIISWPKKMLRQKDLTKNPYNFWRCVPLIRGGLDGGVDMKTSPMYDFCTTCSFGFAMFTFPSFFRVA